MADLKPIMQSDPPPMRRKTGPRKSKYDPMIEELKKKPGKWFLVLEDVATTSSRVFKVKGCQTTTRICPGSKPHRVNVWAMWPAEDSAQNESKPTAKKEAPKKAAPANVTELTKKPVAKKRPTATKR